MARQWQESWREFVRAVAEAYRSGATDAEVTQKFGGSKVHWIGVVTELRLDDRLAYRGLQMRMSRIEVPLTDGRRIVCDALYVGVDTSTEWTWEGTEAGDRVEFEAKIASYDGNYYSIELDADDEGDECVLLVGVGQARRMPQ